MSFLEQWAARHGVSHTALSELTTITAAALLPDNLQPMAKTEGGVMDLVRMEGAAKGVTLMRNNVGALNAYDENTGRARLVRYGLANDSAAINGYTKSSDLIGFRPVIIGMGDVGRTIAQFTARECKKPGWKYTGTDREQAQKRFIDLVNAAGGDAAFAAGPGTLQP